MQLNFSVTDNLPFLLLSPSPVCSIEEIAHRAGPIFTKYNISKAAVFGSFARGEQREDSDVDLVIDFQGGAIKLFHLKEELEEAFLRPVDIITFYTLYAVDDPTFNEPVKQQLKILSWK